jgi:hypothetical protein
MEDKIVEVQAEVIEEESLEDKELRLEEELRIKLTQLTKSERKGLTSSEVVELRKKRYFERKSIKEAV